MSVVEQNEQELKRILTDYGVRPLRHRVAIFHYLVEHPTHPTAEQIYADLKKRMNSISRTTVYNVLNLLCDAHLVSRIGIEKEQMRYDADTKPHVHFLCTSCTHVYDIPASRFPLIELPDGFVGDQVQVFVTGTCPDCASAKEEG